MVSYISQDYNSAVSVKYDIKNQKGGKEISYFFTGKKSTEGKDIYVYYHYYVNGKSASGQEITRGGYLGYKIKVKEKTQNLGPAPTPSGEYGAHLSYNANGGKIKGQDTFEDVANRKSATNKFTFVDISIIDDIPTREGYKFAFWYEPISYGFMRKIYNGKNAPLDTKVYNVAEDKQSKEYTLFPNNPDTNK